MTYGTRKPLQVSDLRCRNHPHARCGPNRVRLRDRPVRRGKGWGLAMEEGVRVRRVWPDETEPALMGRYGL